MRNFELVLLLLAAGISCGQTFTYDTGSDQIVIEPPSDYGFLSNPVVSNYNDAGGFIYQYDYWHGPTRETYIYVENTAEEFFYLQTIRINRYGRQSIITTSERKYFRGTPLFYKKKDCGTEIQRRDYWFAY